MARAKLTEKSRLTFHPLVERAEEGRYIVGMTSTETYVRIPKVGYAVMYMFYHGYTLGEIEERYDEYNVKKFVRKLIARGFVAKIDEREYHYGKHKIVKTLFSWLKPRHVRWLFQPSLYFLYALIIVLGLGLMIFAPNTFPTYDDYFFIDIYSFLIPISFVLGWLLVFLHEAGHFISARSRAIPAEFGIGWRMLYLVAITRVTNLYSMQRRKRYRIIMAGIIVDALVMALGVFVVFLVNTGAITMSLLLYKIIRFIVLAEFLGIIWQFMFFMRTDIYYFFENLTKTNNLQDKCRTYIKSWFIKKYKRTVKRIIKTNKETWIVRLYSLFFLIGAGSVIYTFIYYSLPIAIKLIGRAVSSLLNPTTNTLIYIDSIIYLAFVITNMVLMFYAIRNSAIRHNHESWYTVLTGLILMLNLSFVALMLMLFFEVVQSRFWVVSLSLFIVVLFTASAIRIIRQFREEITSKH